MSTDHAATIKEIERLTKASIALVTVKHPGFTDHGRYSVLNTITGDLEPMGPTERRPRSTRLETTEALAQAVDDDIDRWGDASPRFYFSPQGIIVTLEDFDSGKRWRHEMPFPTHPVFTLVQGLLPSQEFTQKQLVRFLRAKLNGYADVVVVETFRHLKLSGSSDGVSVVAQGRESYGQSVIKKVNTDTGGLIPEEFILSVPVFDLPGVRDSRHDVQILVDTGTDDEGGAVFTLTAVHNTVTAAKEAAQDELRLSLAEHMATRHRLEDYVIIAGLPVDGDDFKA